MDVAPVCEPPLHVVTQPPVGAGLRVRPGRTPGATAKRGTGKIHPRLVAQASQPVQMRVEGRCSSNAPKFSKMLFINNIKAISLIYNPSSAQAGKPVPPDSLG